MGIIVQKFGGTSVADVNRLMNAARRIKQTADQGDQVVAVVSAMGDTTDQLVSLIHQIDANPPAREMDMILTTGEQVSIALLSTALQSLGVPSVSLTGWQAGIETESEHGNARIRNIDAQRILAALQQVKVVIVAGFQGISDDGEITTLGRGGSDTTAVALAGALQAERCEINTDVDGVYTSDPRIVPSAGKLDSISYDEMLELAISGAVVLHPRAVEFAKMYDITLLVRSSFNDQPGTYVEEEPDLEKSMIVTGIAHDTNVAKVKVSAIPIGMVTNLFHYLAEENIHVDMIAMSENDAETFDIAFSVCKSESQKVIEILESHQQELQFDQAICEKGLAKISVVGAGMITNPGITAKMYDVLSGRNIPVKLATTSEIKTSYIIPKNRAVEAARVLHSAFGLDAKELLKAEA